MQRSTLARRAAQLSATTPAPVPANTIAFDSGHAFPGVLPDLTAEAERALSVFRTEALQYAPRPGLPEFRARLVDLMREDAVEITAGHVLVTNGAKHAIELICRVLLDEGDSIVVTAPTYFTAIPIFRSFGVTFIEVGQDGEGLDVEALARRLEQLALHGQRLPKLIYNVPDFHNPTGVTMSHARRRELIDLAVERRIFLVEDSPYRRMRFEGHAVPSLKALDRADIVLHVGTFSKLMAPGLRVGWTAGPPDIIARMIQLKSDGGSCPLTQRVITEFLGAGRLGPHIAEVRARYGANRDRMVSALSRELPEVRFDVPQGGYYLWLTLPMSIDGDAVARCAAEAGVSVLAGSGFFARTDVGHPKHHLRLAYSHASGDEIDEGVIRLAGAFRLVAEGRAVATAR